MQVEGVSNTGTNANPVLIKSSGSLITQSTYTDRSSSIATGGTAQPAMAANVNREDYLFQNISDTDMYISFTGTASTGAGSVLVPSKGTASPENGFVSTQALSVYCASSGKVYTLWEG